MHGVSITVTEVRLSPDLRNATCFVEPLGGEKAEDVVGWPEPRLEVPARGASVASSTSSSPRTSSSATTRARRRGGLYEPPVQPARRAAATSVPPTTRISDGPPQEGRSRPRLGSSRQAARLHLDRRRLARPPAVQRPEGRPRRHAGPAGHRRPADRARRGDQDRPLPDGGRQGLPASPSPGARPPPPSTARAR